MFCIFVKRIKLLLLLLLLLTKRLHDQKFIFFAAPKNACRGTLDSKTHKKETKWVSFDLSKFILVSEAAGNKTKEMNY